MALTKVPSNLDATVATTQSASDNSTNVATTAYVTTALSNLVDSSPSALNTLNELAAALNDDASFSTTVNNSIATKSPLANPTFTTGSVGNFQVASFFKNPKTFITQVGLYNDANELLAIAKLSKPLLKSYSREAIIKVKLDF